MMLNLGLKTVPLIMENILLTVFALGLSWIWFRYFHISHGRLDKVEKGEEDP